VVSEAEISTSVFNQMRDVVTSIEFSDPSSPVKAAHATFLLIFAFVTIMLCCVSTAFCVRVARDSNITMNALDIRRRYQRNMQLYMIVREKKMLDK